MVEAKLHVVLPRRDRARNVAECYVLAIEPSLYGVAAIMRMGADQHARQTTLDLNASVTEAGEALKPLLVTAPQGYTPVTAKVKFPTKGP